MSLVGNLEDLGLGDILQIVSLSRKSGILSLHSCGREGKIVFLHGQVIRASSSVFRENLGDLLLRRQLVDLETLRKALIIQKDSDPPPRIGAILAEQFRISRDAIEDVVKEQVEKIIYSFFGWTEGTFSFELGEPGEVAATSFSPLQFMLEQGLNPQWLAMEGSRILDEKRHRGEVFEEEADGPLVDIDELLGESGTADPAPVDSGPDEVLPGLVLAIDDDEATREVLGRTIKERQLQGKVFGSGVEFLAAVNSAVRDGMQPVLLIDLVMPRLDGSGILGGLELLEKIRSKFPDLSVLVVSDHSNQDAELKVRKLGIATVLAKPKKLEVREGRGLQLLAAIGDALVGLAGGSSVEQIAQKSPLFNLGAELLREMGEPEAGPRGKGPESPGLHLLKGMLQELNNPSLGGGIILLVLRFASELMNRAVIFLVKDREIVGLGQFGIESGGEMADVRVRRMKIPRGQESVFDSVLAEMSPQKVKLGHGQWDQYLRQQLGGGDPEQVFLGPIVSEGRVVAVIYGDNLPEKRKIGDTESLDIFLSQAGLAMEKALLERRLRGKAGI